MAQVPGKPRGGQRTLQVVGKWRVVVNNGLHFSNYVVVRRGTWPSQKRGLVFSVHSTTRMVVADLAEVTKATTITTMREETAEGGLGE
jgi:hypothetical protein